MSNLSWPHHKARRLTGHIWQACDTNN